MQDTGASRPVIFPGEACPAEDGQCTTMLAILPSFGDLARVAVAAWEAVFGGGTTSVAAPVAPTAAQLLRPAGMTNAQFGQLIGWTKGGDLAGNLARTQELIAGLPGRVQALSQAGVTRAMAQQWANFYRNVAMQNPANPNALARSQLMEALGKLLP